MKELGGGIFWALSGKYTKANESVWFYKKDWEECLDNSSLLKNKLEIANKPRVAWNKGIRN